MQRGAPAGNHPGAAGLPLFLPNVTRSVAAMTDEGASLEDAVSRVATCYGIPPASVEKLLALA